MESCFLDIDNNLNKAVKTIEDARSCGAKLVCFPEAFLTGYSVQRMDEAVAVAETIESNRIVKLKKIAKEQKVFLLIPFLEKTCEGIKNSACLIDDEGRVVGNYSKAHLISGEKQVVVPGNSFKIWDTKIGKIGCLICYDLCFPEPARIEALEGAELIVVPSAWRGFGYYAQWWDNNVACRAIDNVLYIAAINQVGNLKDSFFAGKSKVCDPTGIVIAQADGVSEETLFCEIDLDRVKEVRTECTMLKDLREDLYSVQLNDTNER